MKKETRITPDRCDDSNGEIEQGSSPEEALKRALNTPLPGSRAKKRKKKKGEKSDEEEQKGGDLIKTVATVVPPLYVAFRLATGGPEIYVTSIALFSLVAIAHWTNLWPVEA